MGGFIQVFKSRTRLKQDGETSSQKNSQIGQDVSGMALFIVLAAVGVLTLLVTEFTYVAQITQAVAFGSLDQVKAHYLAKSALKLSLLRLKAYKNVKAIVGNGANGVAAVIPKSMIDQIWSFPFSYPIPTNIPGLSMTDKDAINKFQKDSGFDGGSYWTTITSESSKYNLNMLLNDYVPAASASATPQPLPQTPLAAGAPTPSPTPNGSSPPVAFDPESAREGLSTYISTILTNKMLVDTDFADNRRNFRLTDLIDSIASWADRKYESRIGMRGDNKIPFKKAPFYSITELHMIPNMDDELYNLLSPTLTTSTTTGINVNTMQEPVLRALIPKITAEEVTDFFKFRDAMDVDNKFKSEDDFFAYVQRGFSAFLNNPQAVADFKASLTQQNIRIILDETQFKITVEAKVNNSYRTIEAWVDLSSSTAPKTNTTTNNAAGGANNGPPNGNNGSATTQPPNGPGGRQIPDPGIKITFMKII